MSWGSEAASGAADAGSSAGSLYGSMADVGGSSASSAPAASGFSLGTTADTASTGPTVAAGNLQTYGTETPSFMDKTAHMIGRFQKGGDQSLPQAWKNFGNNPETYGYVSGKLAALSRGAGGGQSAPPSVNTTVNYQQPSNPYLDRRRRF